ncbi:capsular polysaccharide export protein, LipB/KpsS family [Vibrio bivalvicida]|uniref:UDP-N-acetylglucosamine 2-epimerase domain-containing protein n=1 Tax=Vibrio bivalvicida TaxID=1276888 RepID=A0A177Y5M7_9VIBR|nr:hypothetical protein [Vibrio bivalvicida]OAJ96171.1 hypothetical protein APB76_01305 [Vibrio bivalvicida]
MVKKQILIVTYGGGHAAMVLPVIQALQGFDNVQVTVLALTTAASQLRDQGVNCVSFKDFTFLVDEQYQVFGSELVDTDAASPVIPVEESIAYMGINMLDLVQEHGEEAAYRLYDEHERQAFLPVRFFKKLISHLNVDLVIATSAPRAERAAIVAASDLGIKSLCMVDLFALQEYRWLKDNNYADVVCVLHQSVKDFLHSHGRSKDNIVVTGNPVFDTINLPTTIQSGLGLRRHRWGDDDACVNILYASQVEPEVHPFISGLKGNKELPVQIEVKLRQFVNKHPNYRLLVRHHPSENRQFHPEPQVEYADESLHDLLHAVDIVVVISSTVGLEAHLAGKPVLAVDTSIFTSDFPLSEMGLAQGIDHLDNLEPGILNASRPSTSDNKLVSLSIDKVMKEVSNLLTK